MCHTPNPSILNRLDGDEIFKEQYKDQEHYSTWRLPEGHDDDDEIQLIEGKFIGRELNGYGRMVNSLGLVTEGYFKYVFVYSHLFFLVTDNQMVSALTFSSGTTNSMGMAESIPSIILTRDFSVVVNFMAVVAAGG